MHDLNEPSVPADDLHAIAAAFLLGTIDEVAYLPTGLMNRNWRLGTDRGVWALKQITDVPLDTARRNLRTVIALHANGVPACPPRLTPDNDPVLQIDERGYCLLPWINGTRTTGPELSLDQARELGAALGRIRDALQRCAPTTGLPTTMSRPTARTVHPDTALAEANRYQAAARAANRGPFDEQVVQLIDHRKLLIDKHSPERPTDEDPHGPSDGPTATCNTATSSGRTDTSPPSSTGTASGYAPTPKKSPAPPPSNSATPRASTSAGWQRSSLATAPSFHSPATTSPMAFTAG